MIINDQTRVYIAGCGGMLGRAVYQCFSQRTIVKATDIDLNEPWLQYADVRDFQQINDSIRSFNPQIIINLAALTDLEYCEQNQENTWLTNGLGAENLALIANKLDALHVYIGTAGIFGGEKDFYTDFDEPHPLSIYAKAKYHGEKFVTQSLNKYFVFRAGWMMGGGRDKDKKFINKIYKQIKAGRTQLFVVDDKFGTPTYTVSFARAIFKVIQTDLCGLYNQVCEGDASRYDVAVEFVKLLGLSDKIQVTRVQSDHFQNEYFAPRPASEKLVNLKLTARRINYMPHWKDALKEYAKEFLEA